jgi:hypothetical protein
MSFEVYDIHTDSMRPMTGEDLDVLQEVYRAYGQVRSLIGSCLIETEGWEETDKLRDFVLQLDYVHERLKERMRERGIIGNVSA